MHFCYIDEAGCTGRNLNDAEQPVFVLGGLSVSDEKWNTTHEKFVSTISNYFNGSIPSGFELHAEELLSPDGDGQFRGHPRDNRNGLAKSVLNIIAERGHQVHVIGLDKIRLRDNACASGLCYDPKAPYLLAYDYMITYLNWYTKQLGRTARAMIVLDEKGQFADDIKVITMNRRYEVTAAHRIKRIVEFSYAVDSYKNPMVQLSDLIVFCAKKFYEMESGYRNTWSAPAKLFFAECYSIIHDRIKKQALVQQEERGMSSLNEFLNQVRIIPRRQWQHRYGVSD